MRDAAISEIQQWLWSGESIQENFFFLDKKERPQLTDENTRLGVNHITIQKINLVLSFQVEIIHLKEQQSLVYSLKTKDLSPYI